MKQTTNYALNQWAGGDRLLCADFNSDNSKIDAAIAAIAAAPAYQKIMEITTTAQANQIDLDVSSVRFADWQYILLDTSLCGNGDTYLRVNNNASASYRTLTGSTSNNGSMRWMRPGSIGDPTISRTEFIVAHNGKGFALVRGQDVEGFSCGHAYTRYREITTINLFTEGSNFYLSAGCKLTLLGVK